MKHSKKIVGIMLAIFLLAQFIGLGIVYYDHVNLQESSADNLVFLEPDVEAPVSDTNMPFFFIILILIYLCLKKVYVMILLTLSL